jgi:hypothetical protein
MTRPFRVCVVASPGPSPGSGGSGRSLCVTKKRFDPVAEKFESFPSDRPNSNVRQMLGRKGEAWIAESGTERVRVIRYPAKTN